MQAINELLLTLDAYNAPLILAIVGGLLILADYYFDTDVPAHFGYACFGLAAFIMGPATLRESLLIGVLVWSMLLNLHFMFLRAILERDVTEPAQT